VGSRMTISEMRWPETPEFSEMIATWQYGAATRVLELVWAGYDALHRDVLSMVDQRQLGNVQETEVTQLLVVNIRRHMEHLPSFWPFDVWPESWEFEGQSEPPARAKQYDFAFRMRENPRIAWPFEAKVLKTDATLAAYVEEIRSNFITCRYAPFSSQAGMVGYLLSGSPQTALAGIAERLACKLTQHPDFLERTHSTSDHDRKVPKGKTYPTCLRLHHLILQLTCPEPGAQGPP